MKTTPKTVCTTKRTHILERIQALREKKNTIVQAAMERFFRDMKGKTPDERRKANLHGTCYTPEDWDQISELNDKLAGLQHTLQEGFFQKHTPNATPRWVTEALY